LIFGIYFAFRLNQAGQARQSVGKPSAWQCALLAEAALVFAIFKLSLPIRYTID